MRISHQPVLKVYKEKSGNHFLAVNGETEKTVTPVFSETGNTYMSHRDIKRISKKRLAEQYDFVGEQKVKIEHGFYY